jgi:hypothetical protein
MIMALRKKKELATGLVAEYWRITTVTITPPEAMVFLDLYANETARRAGKIAIPHESYSVSCPDGFTIEAMDKKNPIALAYERFRQEKPGLSGLETNWFADAEDC